MSSINHCAVLIGISLLTPLACAQQLQEIEIIGRRVNLIGTAAAASEGRVSHEELQRRPLLRTGEILESVPGVVATQHSGSGKANQFFLRGFNLDHGTDFSTTIDGMPVNMRSHGHGQGYTDLNFIIPELIEEIQFRKGTYFADTGDFSAAGSAIIATAQHLDATSVSVGLGEYGFKRMLLSGAVENGQGDFIYGLEHQKYDGPWEMIDENVNKTNLWLKQRWQTNSDLLELMFMAYDNDWNSADQIPARAVSSGQISNFGSIDTSVGGDSSRYSLSANWQHKTESAVFLASLYGIDYEMDLFSNFSYFTTPQGDQFQQVDQRKIYGGSLEWQQQSLVAGLSSVNTFGTQLRLDDIAQVGLRSSAQRQILGAIRLDAVKQASAGIYWQNELHWSERLRSIFGLRYDYYDFDVKALEASDPRTLLSNSGSTTADIVTSSLSLVYALNANNEIYASIGQGFHSNDARGTTIQFDPGSGQAVLPVDPLVDALGSEIGLRTFLTDRLNASIALWQLDIDSELLFVGDAGNTEDTGASSTRKGIELTSYYQLNDLVLVDLEYSWADSRFTQKTNGIDGIPGALRNVFSGGMTLTLSEKLEATMRLRFFDDYALDEGEKAEGSTMVNLRLSYRPTLDFSITADVLNLFDSSDHDVEYFYESQLLGETAPVADHHYHVFEPRALRLYFNHQF